MVDIVKHNSGAWDAEVRRGNMWTIPVSPEEVERARAGKASFLLTPECPVPESWYMPVKGKKLLLLASGGGQQGPLFAALGADVTVFDNSVEQLNRDIEVAKREGLEIKTIQGDMKDLSVFADESFDMIFHPVSNCFVDDIKPVWKESFRVLKKGGTMLAGVCNSIRYIFDLDEMERGNLIVKNIIPYSDVEQMEKADLQKRIDNNLTLEYGHSLEQQLGGMLKAGFCMVDFFESDFKEDLLSKYIDSFIAVRLVKPQFDLLAKA